MLLSIFFTSVSLFLYQVILTRIYSTILSYHYVFLITSLAVFGLGIGSIISYVLRKHEKSNNKAMTWKDSIGVLSTLLSLSFITTFVMIYFLSFTNNVVIYTILGIAPFIVGGLIYSILFTTFTDISGKLYFVDLIGSGIGSVVVILLLNQTGMLRTVLTLSIVALIPALILPSYKKIKVVSYILPIILIGGLLLPTQYINTIEKSFKGITENAYKTYGNLKRNGMSPEIIYSKWNAFSRTDVIQYDDEEKMIVTIDGSANAPMYKFDGNMESLEKYKSSIGFLPFAIGKNTKTLLIGSGGGSDVLYALAGGSKDISAVEINTASIDAVKAYGEYNGNIYNRPEVKVYGEDGRSFVRKSKDKFDLIFMSLVMTSTTQGVGYSLSENYIYTVEAMGDYLDHINDNGKIAFLAHDSSDLSKIIATAIQALEERGIPLKETPNYIAVFSDVMKGHGSIEIHSPVVIIKNTAYSQEESNALKSLATKNGSLTIYAPLVYEEGPLNYIKEGQLSLKDFIEGFEINVTPATDNNPYFYNYNKGVPTILIFILVVVIVGSLVMFTPFVIKKRAIKQTTYFGLLGMGYMMIEIPLIQKFILYLGHPTLAFTFVLAALLVGSGIGGYYSHIKIFNKMKTFYLPPAMVALINIIFLLSMELIFQSTSTLNIVGRISIAVILVMIQGFFMGMPFPRGVKIMGENRKSELVPVMWGVNGITSVIGSVLSTVLSMLIGFSGAMMIGAAVYILVSFFKELKYSDAYAIEVGGDQ